MLMIGAAMQGNGARDPRPEVPEKIKAPAGEQVVLKARASGSQIYVCQKGTDGSFAWTLKAPEAELRDDQGRLIGRHFAGPTWKLNDGSEITAKPVVRVDFPDSIPWLLLAVTGHSGNGVLSNVASVQRIHTKGGVAPPATDCGAATQNSETKVAYTADYYFYAPVK